MWSTAPLVVQRQKLKKKMVKQLMLMTEQEKSKKILQLKKAMIKFKEKAERLEKELEALRVK